MDSHPFYVLRFPCETDFGRAQAGGWRCNVQVGQAGVVVQDRRNTLVLMTPGDRQLVVAKQGTVLHVPLPGAQALVVRGEGMTSSFV